jgi:aspartate/methionine/tyrosine aminotransferase
MRFHSIHYLRWARSRRVDLERDFPLLYSGMMPPAASSLTMPDGDALLRFDSGDRPALCTRLAADLGVDPASVWIQPGTHWLLFQLAAAALELRPGAIVVEEPAYEPLRRIAESLSPRVLRLPRPRGRDYALDRHALKELEAQGPALLLLSQPHNPSGVSLAGDDVARLAAFASATRCRILSDEVYGAFDPDNTLLGRIEGAAVVSSFTKVMGLGGLRCSSVVAPPEWLEIAQRISDYGPVALPAPSQALAMAAWESREELWARARHRAAENRVLVDAWLHDHDDLLDAFLPDAGIICFARLRPQTHEAAVAVAARRGVRGPFGFGLDRSPGGSHEWIEALRRDERVHLVPGAFFEDPRAFRLGFGCEREQLREGLMRLSGFLREAMEEA